MTESVNARLVEALKPCPFCGSLDVGVYEGSTFRWLLARCNECGAQAGDVRVQTAGSGTPEEWNRTAANDAIAEWNRRAALADLPAQTTNARLVEALKNFEITGPDGDGIVWMVFHANGTGGKALAQIGHKDRIAAQVALLFEADRRAALAEAEGQAVQGWAHAVDWLRNNYQDYANVASLCDAMLAAAPEAPKPLETQERDALWRAYITDALAGIGETEIESENGWWGTSEGAEFGNRILAHCLKGPDAAPEAPAPAIDPRFDVRTILLDVVPGDGEGHEVYATCVDDVVGALTALADKAAPTAPAVIDGEVAAAWNSVREAIQHLSTLEILQAAEHYADVRVAQATTAPAVAEPLSDDAYQHVPLKVVKTLHVTAQRDPLTDEQISELWSWSMTRDAERTATTQQHAFARAVERAHGIGGK